MKTEIICVGTEVLMGDIVNTNAQNISKIAARNGHYVYYSSVVGDNYSRAYEVINIAILRSELIIISGGLGPTEDDITLKVVADIIGKDLVYDKNIEKNIMSFLNTYEVTDNIKKVSMKIQGAKILNNLHGTAHGNIIEFNDSIIVVLPGPPSECLPMLESCIKLFDDKSEEKLISKTIKLTNIPEAKAARILGNIITEQTDPTIAPYCKFMEVQFRITTRKDDSHIKRIENKLDDYFGNNIFSKSENYFIEDDIYRLILEQKLTISLAESCTGGMIASTLINVSGMSNCLKESYITYSSSAKKCLLNVKSDTINKYGEASCEVVTEMLGGLIEKTGSDSAIAVSGISGPNSDISNKKVGYTVIGTYIKDKGFIIKEYMFDGNRNQNRTMATKAALIQYRNHLLKLNNEYDIIYSTDNRC